MKSSDISRKRYDNPRAPVIAVAQLVPTRAAPPVVYHQATSLGRFSTRVKSQHDRHKKEVPTYQPQHSFHRRLAVPHPQECHCGR